MPGSDKNTVYMFVMALCLDAMLCSDLGNEKSLMTKKYPHPAWVDFAGSTE